MIQPVQNSGDYGGPQGSVLGLILFSLCTVTLGKVIGRHPFIKFHFYADDSEFFIHLTQKNVTQSKTNQVLR